MSDAPARRVTALQSFSTFVRHFVNICYVLRGVLGVQLVLVLSAGFLYSRIEDLSAWDGMYFAIITATSVGYGDISPTTLSGQLISIFLAMIGTIFFGLVVASATRSVTVTVEEYGIRMVDRPSPREHHGTGEH